MSGIRIRRATKRECRVVHKLSSECPTLAPPGSISLTLGWVTAFVTEERTRLFVAVDGVEVVGFACGERVVGDNGLIWMLYVRPERRGAGIGARLLDALEAALIADFGVVAFVAYASSHSMRMFRERGYAHTGERFAECIKLVGE